MRIVLYNFVQPDDPKTKQGGGVATYQRNLAAVLTSHGHDVILMSSGDRYALMRKSAFIVFGSDCYQKAIIFNSPMFAPAHFSFHNLGNYVDSDGLNHIPADLKKRYPDIDVFHFQNIEGLTAKFFHWLRTNFPVSRMIFTAHNYNSVCGQVNLWFREYKACDDYLDGRKCVNCLLAHDRTAHERNIRRAERGLELFGFKKFGPVERFARAAIGMASRTRNRLAWQFKRSAPATRKHILVTSAAKAADYKRYREENIRVCSQVFDAVLAVSRRTRQVLIDNGVRAENISVSYIGTAHHAIEPAASPAKKRDDGRLHIAFLGYMRADKGFYFLLDALETLTDDFAARLSVTVAAPIHDESVVPRLRAMAHRFDGVDVFDGYTPRALDEILASVTLGIVPVLWEDNLPQVAIEMVARGIPILTSDRGGAQEIGRNANFVFRAGSKLDFGRKLFALADGEISLSSFWDKAPNIISMEAHLQELMGHYRGGRRSKREPGDRPAVLVQN